MVHLLWKWKERKNINEICRQKLSPTEAKRHFIRVRKKYRDMFPPAGETFVVVIDNEKFEVTVGSLNRIWAAIFWDKLPHFREGDTIVFSKNPDGSFNVSIEG